MNGRDIRRLVLEQSYRAGVGHIASCLSVADVLAALYGGLLRIPAPDHPERDRFILSKGHAALALYAALHLRGTLSREDLASFFVDGSRLGVHPDHRVPGIDASTGSLGQGLSIGVGMALAARAARSTRRVFVLVSDAECNEGSLWEAVMFAAHHHLGGLTVIVDDNRQQALGPTSEILDLEPLEARWDAFGWRASRIDGHDADALTRALATPPPDDRPSVWIADTVAGKGVSFMERNVDWHYLPMSAAQYEQARRELETVP